MFSDNCMVVHAMKCLIGMLSLPNFVRAERLELSHLAALDPKSSVSTNSTTPAFCPTFITIGRVRYDNFISKL